MTSPASPAVNAPLTAASITGALALVLAAFTNLTADQIAAVNAVAGLVAAYLLQRYHTDPKGTP